MDSTRDTIRKLIRDQGKTLTGLSKALGRNPSYLQQYLERGSPKELPDKVRRNLAKLLNVSEEKVDVDSRGMTDLVNLPADHYLAALMVVEYVQAHSKTELTPPQKIRLVQEMRDLIVEIRGQ